MTNAIQKMQNKKLTIGLLIEVEGTVDVEGYKTTLRSGVTRAAKDNNVNLICFAGGALHRSPYHFEEKQRNIIYDFISSDILDGILVVSTIGSFSTEEELSNFFEKLNNIPTVYVSEIRENVQSIYVDNYNGMSKLIEHLIIEHKYRSIAFIRGTEGNAEADIRFKIYRDKLEHYGIPFDKNLVVSGNFLMESGIDAIKTLFDKRKIKPDCIIASNDHMAIGALSELEKRGISVPEEIAIVGFDDSIKAQASMPALTTVKQPIFELGIRSCNMLIDLIKSGEIKPPVKLESELIIRQSCGCFSNLFLPFVMPEKDNNKRIPGSNELEKVYKSVKDRIYAELKKSSSYLEEDLEQFTKWIDELFISISSLIKQECATSNEFLRILNKIMKLSKIGRYEINIWRKTLFYLYDSLIPEVSDCDLVSKIHGILHEALLLINENGIHLEAYERLQSELKLENLHEISKSLFAKNVISEIMNILSKELPKLDINCCVIALYKEQKIIEKHGIMMLPEWSRLIMFIKDQQQIEIEDEGRYFQTYELIPDMSLLFENPAIYILEPLFFGDIQLGYAVFEQGPKEGIIYEMLRNQISNALYVSRLYQERKKSEEKLIETLMELEYTNKKLSSLSLCDEMTGLYNRRGFFTHADQYINIARDTKKSFLLFFADLEGLKRINDTYGHSEGDNAIKKSADILRNSFNESDIIARIGGDEFTVLAVNKSKKDIPKIKSIISSKLNEYNLNSEKPYRVSIVMGVAIFHNDVHTSLNDLMIEADKDLYKNKKELRIL